MRVRIGDREVGDGCPVFIIAEAGVNHNGEPALAEQLVEAAAFARADAVKFQLFDPDSLVIAGAECAAYQRRAGEGGQLDMLRRLTLGGEDVRRLARRAHCLGLVFLATPFDFASVDLLESLDVAAIKVSSGDLTNDPLLVRIASTGRPLIISTGMSSLGEVEHAIETVDSDGNVVLLHCTSAYPADPRSANLRCMDLMRTAFSVPVGYSDHTPGLAVGIAAAALGASVLEKHVTLDRTMAGPDHAASIEPGELAELVKAVHEVSAALGDGVKRPSGQELEVRDCARRSLVSARPITRGEVIDVSMLAIKRPGTGLAPQLLTVIAGRTAQRDIPADTPLTWDMI